MKTILLGTAALLALSLGAAPTRAELEVTVGGFVAFQAAAFDNDTANSTSRDFQSESELTVEAAAVTDGGLEYGAYVQIESSTNDSANAGKTFVYLGGEGGKVELGDMIGAGSMAIGAPTVGAGQINGSYDDYVPTADQGHALNNRGDARFSPFDSEYATKATYYTPRLWGLQLGVSYVPEVDSMAAGEQVQFSDSAGNHENMVELGATYERDIAGVAFTLGGTYNHAGAKTGAGLEDVSSWGLGAQFGHEGFTLGGGYISQGESGNAVTTAADTVNSWNLGLTYEDGPWGAGVSYLTTDFNTNGDSGGFLGSDGTGGTYSALVLGGTYLVADGLTVGADLAFYERNRAAGADTSGYVLVTDVAAAF